MLSLDSWFSRFSNLTQAPGGNSDLGQKINKTNMTLEEVLSDETLMVNFKCGNKDVLHYFYDKERFKKLIHYITVEPEEDEFLKGHKYPYVASEILKMNIAFIQERFLLNEKDFYKAHISITMGEPPYYFGNPNVRKIKKPKKSNEENARKTDENEEEEEEESHIKEKVEWENDGKEAEIIREIKIKQTEEKEEKEGKEDKENKAKTESKENTDIKENQEAKNIDNKDTQHSKEEKTEIKSKEKKEETVGTKVETNERIAENVNLEIEDETNTLSQNKDEENSDENTQNSENKTECEIVEMENQSQNKDDEKEEKKESGENKEGKEDEIKDENEEVEFPDKESGKEIEENDLTLEALPEESKTKKYQISMPENLNLNNENKAEAAERKAIQAKLEEEDDYEIEYFLPDPEFGPESQNNEMMDELLKFLDSDKKELNYVLAAYFANVIINILDKYPRKTLNYFYCVRVDALKKIVFRANQKSFSILSTKLLNFENYAADLLDEVKNDTSIDPGEVIKLVENVLEIRNNIIEEVILSLNLLKTEDYEVDFEPKITLINDLLKDNKNISKCIMDKNAVFMHLFEILTVDLEEIMGKNEKNCRGENGNEDRNSDKKDGNVSFGEQSEVNTTVSGEEVNVGGDNKKENNDNAINVINQPTPPTNPQWNSNIAPFQLLKTYTLFVDLLIKVLQFGVLHKDFVYMKEFDPKIVEIPDSEKTFSQAAVLSLGKILFRNFKENSYFTQKIHGNVDKPFASLGSVVPKLMELTTNFMEFMKEIPKQFDAILIRNDFIKRMWEMYKKYEWNDIYHVLVNNFFIKYLSLEFSHSKLTEHIFKTYELHLDLIEKLNEKAMFNFSTGNSITSGVYTHYIDLAYKINSVAGLSTFTEAEKNELKIKRVGEFEYLKDENYIKNSMFFLESYNLRKVISDCVKWTETYNKIVVPIVRRYETKLCKGKEDEKSKAEKKEGKTSTEIALNLLEKSGSKNSRNTPKEIKESGYNWKGKKGEESINKEDEGEYKESGKFGDFCYWKEGDINIEIMNSERSEDKNEDEEDEILKLAESVEEEQKGKKTLSRIKRAPIPFKNMKLNTISKGVVNIKGSLPQSKTSLIKNRQFIRNKLFEKGQNQEKDEEKEEEKQRKEEFSDNNYWSSEVSKCLDEEDEKEIEEFLGEI